MSTVHIEASREEIAKLVIMPGDPERSKYIAHKYLKDVIKVNDVRGESAFTGYYKGVRVTVFPSGMGIPSMGIYSHELFNNYDVDVIIRVGTAGSYDLDLKIKDLFLVTSSFSQTHFDEEADIENREIILPSSDLNSVIEVTADEIGLKLKEGRAHTVEAFYQFNPINRAAVDRDCMVAEMESFALFLNARKFQKKAAALLTISDSLVTKEEISREDRATRLNEMITLALESLIKFDK